MLLKKISLLAAIVLTAFTLTTAQSSSTTQKRTTMQNKSTNTKSISASSSQRRSTMQNRNSPTSSSSSSSGAASQMPGQLSGNNAQMMALLMKTDINSLSESQIKMYAERIKAQGMSLDMVIAAAEQNGAGTTQIDAIRRRLQRYLPIQSELGAQGMDSESLLTDDPLLGERILSEKKEFEASEYDKKVYGFNIFNKENLTFEPSINMAVSESYVIGIGDEVMIDIYGAATNDYILEVSKEGTIIIPMVGPINVAGLTLADTRVVIKNKLRTIYSDLGVRTQAVVRVGAVQPIVVSVMGEAFMPGTYTVSSAASLLHVLYLCGGPSSSGSYRDIQLIRQGKIVKHLDVYNYLIYGKMETDISLQDGDIVLVPAYQKRVAVGGAFKRTGYFEAKEGETADDLIRFAGGFSERALTDHVGIHRVGRFATEFKSVNNPKTLQLANGDSISVAEIDLERLDNSVTLEGAVFAPGNYEYVDGLTISKLIAQAGGLKENAFLPRGIIVRLKDDYTTESVSFDVAKAADCSKDVALKSGDKVLILTIDETREERTVEIIGEVNDPGVYDFCENLTVGDLVIIAGGLTEKASLANIEILRQLTREEAKENPETSSFVIPINITADLAIDSMDNSFKLEPFDKLFIRTRGQTQRGGSVTLTGAFELPGYYGLSNNRVRVSEIVKRANMTANADVYAARIYRHIEVSEIEKELKIQRSTELMIDTVPYLKEGSSSYELVAINLKEAIEKPGSAADIFLKDGDIISIPEKNYTVRVGGMVQNPTSLQWTNSWNAKDYVKASGGFEKKANKKHTYVIYPNGQSASVTHLLFFRRYPKVLPGSEIVVPQRPEVNIEVSSVVSMTTTVLSMITTIAIMIIK